MDGASSVLMLTNQVYPTDNGTHLTDSKKEEAEFQQKVESHLYYRAAMAIKRFSLFGLYPAGVLSNIISFLVMNMKHNKKSTTCLYMSVIAVADSLVLVRRFLAWTTVMAKAYSSEDMVWVCKVNYVTHYVFTGFSAYSIVFMTFDKFCAIMFPHKANVLCTRNKVGKITVLNAFIVALIYLPKALFSGKDPNNLCTGYTHKAWYIDVYKILLLVYYPLIPVCALFFFNISIIKAVCRRPNRKTHPEKRLQDRQMTVMLLMVTFVFIVLLLPFEISDAFLMGSLSTETPAGAAKSTLVFQVTSNLMMLNYCVNFYLYLLSGSKFRNDLRSLLGFGAGNDIVSQMSEQEAGDGQEHKTLSTTVQQISAE